MLFRGECQCIIDKRIHAPKQININQPLTLYARQSIGERTGKSENRRPDLPPKSCQTKRANLRSSSASNPPRRFVGNENWKKLGHYRTGSQRISSPRQTARSPEKDLTDTKRLDKLIDIEYNISCFNRLLYFKPHCFRFLL
jgi:hypothetical protein